MARFIIFLCKAVFLLTINVFEANKLVSLSKGKHTCNINSCKNASTTVTHVSTLSLSVSVCACLYMVVFEGKIYRKIMKSLKTMK